MDEYCCNMCERFLPAEEFYISTRKKTIKSGTCKECYKEKEKLKYRKEVEEKGGSFLVNQKPHTFTCSIQKEQTFILMERLGWKINPDGTWWKDGVKTKEGIWLRMKSGTKINRKKELKKIKQEMTIDNLPKMEYVYSTTNPIDFNILNEMMYDYFINKKPMKKVVEGKNISIEKFNYWVLKVYNYFLPEELKYN